ncbi:MAG: hypothetical protein RI907_2060 [Pseudomonadota bacterium]|jgi:hypothetical protein
MHHASHVTSTRQFARSPAAAIRAVAAAVALSAWGAAWAQAEPTKVSSPAEPTQEELAASLSGLGALPPQRTLAKPDLANDVDLRSLADAPSLAPLPEPADAAAVSQAPEEAPAAGATPRWSLQTWQRVGGSLRSMWSRVQTRLQAFGPTALITASGSGNGEPTRSLLLGTQLHTPDSSLRASAGLVRSETGNWWQTHTDRYGGLGSSYSRLSASGVLSSASSLLPCDPAANTALPYLGASFSSRLTGDQRSASSWRLNADLGVVSIQNARNTPLGQTASSERSFDEVVRDLRIRPNVKVSVGYSF